MNLDPDDLNLESNDDDSILDPFNLEGGGPPGGSNDFDDLEEPLPNDGGAFNQFTEGDGGSLEDRIFVGEAVALDLEDDREANANPFDDLDAPAAPPPPSSAEDRNPAATDNTESGNPQSPTPPGAPRGDGAPNNPPAGVDESPSRERQEPQPYRAPRDAAGNPVV